MKESKTHTKICKNKSDELCLKCSLGIVSKSLIYHIMSTIVKAVIGVMAGSQVLIAEAVHSLTDTFAFGINYFVASEKETVIFWQSIFIGSIMFLSGVWICSDNIAILISTVPAHPGLLSLVISVFSIGVNVYLYRVSACTYKLNPSNNNLLLCQIQNKVNCFASSIASIGILLAIIGFVYLDPFFAFFIGCFQIKGAFQIFKEGFSCKIPGINSIKPSLGISLSILSLLIIGLFSLNTLGLWNKQKVILIPSTGIVASSPTSSLLGRAKYFYVIDTNTNTSVLITNNNLNLPTDVGLSLVKIINEQGVGVVIAEKIGAEMFALLSEQNVKMYYIKNTMPVGEAFSLYQKGKLKLARSSNVTSGFGKSQVRWLKPW